MIEIGKGVMCPYCGAKIDQMTDDGTYKCSYCENAILERLKKDVLFIEVNQKELMAFNI